jgi:hypothetical protein
LCYFDTAICGAKLSNLSFLAEAATNFKTVYSLYLHLICQMFPLEISLVPFKILRVVLDWTIAQDSKTSEQARIEHSKYNLGDDEKAEFLEYFRNVFFDVGVEGLNEVLKVRDVDKEGVINYGSDVVRMENVAQVPKALALGFVAAPPAAPGVKGVKRKKIKNADLPVVPSNVVLR